MAPHDNSDEYTADEIDETTEERAVWRWRFDELLRTGYPELLASMLASDRRVDLELARRLVARLPAHPSWPPGYCSRPCPRPARRSRPGRPSQITWPVRTGSPGGPRARSRRPVGAP